mmetsp:Transcript_39103/g.103209  ORF Transcript_39103/g.103209 Transcript_39103/m.103209 type:complete len:145 (-) Transcript_39103:268-702(-)
MAAMTASLSPKCQTTEELDWCRGASDASTAVPLGGELSESEEEAPAAHLPGKRQGLGATAVPAGLSGGDLVALVLLMLAMAVAVLAHLYLPAAVGAVLGSLFVSIVVACALVPGSVLPAVVALLLIPAHIGGAATYLAVQTPVF